DDAIFGDRINDETRPRRLDRLMMRAVNAEALYAGDAVEQGAGDDPDRVSGLAARVRLAMRQAIRDFVWDGLRQCAPKRNIHELLPAADPEHRHPSLQRPLRGGELERGAAVLGLDGRMPRFGTEQRRVDIKTAAGDDQPVDLLEIRGGRLGV